MKKNPGEKISLSAETSFPVRPDNSLFAPIPFSAITTGLL
jgi:hypothetical protein